MEIKPEKGCVRLAIVLVTPDDHGVIATSLFSPEVVRQAQAGGRWSKEFLEAGVRELAFLFFQQIPKSQSGGKLPDFAFFQKLPNSQSGGKPPHSTPL